MFDFRRRHLLRREEFVFLYVLLPPTPGRVLDEAVSVVELYSGKNEQMRSVFNWRTEEGRSSASPSTSSSPPVRRCSPSSVLVACSLEENLPLAAGCRQPRPRPRPCAYNRASTPSASRIHKERTTKSRVDSQRSQSAWSTSLVTVGRVAPRVDDQDPAVLRPASLTLPTGQRY